MNREHRPVGVRYALDQGTDQLAELVRQVVADRVRDVHRGGARVDHRLDHPAEKVDLGTTGILGRELDIVGKAAGAFHCVHGLLDDLPGLHAQLHLHVDGRCRDEGVDARGGCGFQGLAGPVDIPVECARQAADRAARHRPGHGLDRLEIARAGDREARLYNINLHALQCLGDTDLFVTGHRCAGALFAVAQGGIKNDQLVVHCLAPAGSTSIAKRPFCCR
jgi:hypothetical protein